MLASGSGPLAGVLKEKLPRRLCPWLLLACPRACGSAASGLPGPASMGVTLFMCLSSGLIVWGVGDRQATGHCTLQLQE